MNALPMTSEHCQRILDDVMIFCHLAVESTFLYSLHHEKYYCLRVTIPARNPMPSIDGNVPDVILSSYQVRRTLVKTDKINSKRRDKWIQKSNLSIKYTTSNKRSFRANWFYPLLGKSKFIQFMAGKSGSHAQVFSRTSKMK